MKAKPIIFRFVKQIVDGTPKIDTPPTKFWYNIERTTFFHIFWEIVNMIFYENFIDGVSIFGVSSIKFSNEF